MSLPEKSKESPSSERLAREHWDWIKTWLEIVYVDAFIHGYKHGIEGAKK